MHSRFFKFFVSRLIGTLVDTFILWILSSFVFSTYIGRYIIAPALSFEVAMFNNYVISYVWIWHQNIAEKTARDFWRRLLKYNLSTLVGFGIKMGFLLIFERIFRWDVVYCNIAALLISGFANFILAEYLVFRKPSLAPLVESLDPVKVNPENIEVSDPDRKKNENSATIRID